MIFSLLFALVSPYLLNVALVDAMRGGSRYGNNNGMHPDQMSDPYRNQDPRMAYQQNAQAYAQYTAEGVPYNAEPGHALPYGYPVAPNSHQPMEYPNSRPNRHEAPHEQYMSPPRRMSEKERRRRQRQGMSTRTEDRLEHLHRMNQQDRLGQRHTVLDDIIYYNAMEEAIESDRQNRREEAAEDAQAQSSATTGTVTATSPGNDGTVITAGGEDNHDGWCECGSAALEGFQHCGDCIASGCSTIGDGIHAAGEAVWNAPGAIMDNCYWPTCPTCNCLSCPDCNCCSDCDLSGLCDGGCPDF